MKKLTALVAAVMLCAGAAEAKWWIFGKTGGEIGLKYLHINKVSADETGAKMTIYKEALGPEGLLRIAGKAATGKSAVGSVRVSLDDKATWIDVKFADNGTFEHSFKPETGRTYALLVEVTDTAGKTNKVAETRKEITISADPIQAKVREALDSLFDAYNREQFERFMVWVGDDFAGDKALLERAVKRDFDALSNIVMRYTINSVAAGQGGRIFVSVTFNRMVMVNKTGAMNTDSGATEFVLSFREGKLALYSMKQPLVFGLSDAANVATGEVLGNTSANLVIDESGTLGGGGELVTIDCRGTGNNVMKYTFATGAQACDSGGGGANIWFYTAMANQIGYSVAQHAEFSEPIYSLTAAEVRNAAAYSANGNVYGISTGNSYCFDLTPDYYCVEPVAIPSAGNEKASFKLKKF